jgi:hypothetical protein
VVSKCANPACAASFQYMHEGKLFKLDRRSIRAVCLDPPGKNCEEKPARNVEYFWLCGECASTMTLVLRPHVGPVGVPLKSLGEKAGAGVPGCRAART